jgi:CHAD domain-containing protein
MEKHLALPAALQQYVETQFRYTHHLSTLGLSKTDLIHELRLILKRLRAVATLLKSRPGFSSLNEELKKMSQALAPRRDHDIVEEWLAKHRKTTPEHLLSTFRSISLKPRPPSMLSIRENLLALEARFTGLLRHPQNLEVDGRAAVRRGFRKIKIAAQRAKKTETSVDFHNLRKQIKTFQYQMESLGLADDKKIKKLSRKINDLTSILGKSHDLHLIGETFASLHRTELKPLCQKLLNQRNNLNRRALITAKDLVNGLS